MKHDAKIYLKNLGALYKLATVVDFFSKVYFLVILDICLSKLLLLSKKILGKEVNHHEFLRAFAN